MWSGRSNLVPRPTELQQSLVVSLRALHNRLGHMWSYPILQMNGINRRE